MAASRVFLLTAVLGVAGLAVAAVAAAQGASRPTSGAAAPDWKIYRGNAALQGVAPGRLGDAPELLWSFESGGAILSSPVVADGVVYFGSADMAVYAVDLATGVKRWSFATEDFVDAPPLVHDGTVYVGSSDFFFYALDAATGALRWKHETEDKIIGGANVIQLADGTVRIVVGSYDSRLYGFDPATGAVAWTYQTDNYVNGTPAAHGEDVIFGGCDAVLHVVSARTGARTAAVELGGDCHVAGSVAVADGRAYFGHYGNEFICVDLATGDIVWSYPDPRHAFFASPAIGDDRVVFGGRDKNLHCVRRSDGEPLWTFATRRKVDGSPLICGDKVVFGSGDGRLYMLRLDDGVEVWRYEIGRPIFSSPAIVGSTILIGANDGRLYAFRAPPRGN